MPSENDSRFFYVGLIIGALASFLGSLAAGFLQAFVSKGDAVDLLLFVLTFAAFGGILKALYDDLIAHIRQQDNTFNPAA
jgi:hypothetical protein